MKRALPWIALGLALMLGIAVCDGLRTRDGYSVIIGQKDEAIKVRDEIIADQDAIIQEKNGTITAQTAKIAELLGNASKPTEAEKAKDAKIASLNTALASAKTDAERVPVLEGLVAEWQGKFTLSEQRRKDELAALNGEWQVKFDAQIEISNAWKAKYEAQARVAALALDGLKLADRKLKVAGVVGNIKTGIIVVAGGLVAYSMIKGKE